MRLFIDASNISVGGGITHLHGILAESALAGRKEFSSIELAASDKTCEKLKGISKEIQFRNHELLERSIAHRYQWTKKVLPRWLAEGPTILFNPGGGYTGSFRPYVTMSRNMLVFDRVERARYNFTLTGLRLWLLNKTQTKSLNRASGRIYISQYARNTIEPVLTRPCPTAIIHHGVQERFRLPAKPQCPPSNYSDRNPYKLLYVSIVDRYKHQDMVIAAVRNLVEQGLPIELNLVGPINPALESGFRKILNDEVNKRTVVHHGKLSPPRMRELYQACDASVFASTCENMPNILIEAMSSGHPIACSNYPPMPEFLRDGGVYFDPLNPKDIAKTLSSLFLDEKLRSNLILRSTAYAGEYNWSKSALETFQFLAKVAKN